MRGATKLELEPERSSDVVSWHVAPVPSGPDWKFPPSGTVNAIGFSHRPEHGVACVETQTGKHVASEVRQLASTPACPVARQVAPAGVPPLSAQNSASCPHAVMGKASQLALGGGPLAPLAVAWRTCSDSKS